MTQPAPNPERAENDTSEVGQDSVLDLLGTFEDPMDAADPVSFARSLMATMPALARNPAGVAAANLRLAIGWAAAARATLARTVGLEVSGPVAPGSGDRRFADPAYTDNPLYFWFVQQYLLAGQLVAELLDAARLEGVRDRKARMAASFLIDALAPNNTLPGNPAALRRAFDTGGKSVVRGASHLVDDVLHNGGWPSQVDSSGFEVGVNMAATPGAVVYRSDLIELIQYRPQTDRVHSVPLLFCPPWINKYYIMDLAPGKSLIEWAVNHACAAALSMPFAWSVRSPVPRRSTRSRSAWAAPSRRSLSH